MMDYSINKLYGFLIKGRFVKKTYAKLQAFTSLLYRADKDALQLKNVEINVFKFSNKDVSEFCWRTHCLNFAEIVLREIEPVFVHLGGDLMTLAKITRCRSTVFGYTGTTKPSVWSM